MIWKRWISQCSSALIAAAGLAACTNLPASGPYPIAVEAGSTTKLASNPGVAQLEYAWWT